MANRRFHSMLVLVLMMILCTPYFTGAVGKQESSSPASPGDRVAVFEELRHQAFDAFYNLDYDTSAKLFKQIAESMPEHPAGHLYLATQVWVDYLNRARRLQTGVYSSASFYSKTEEKVDPEADRQFQEHVQEAIKKAEARLQENDRDVEARYFLGAAYGILAAYQASVAREFFTALKNGSRAVDEHRKIIKQDPQFADAYLTIGIYDYIVGSLPLWVKMIATLGGVRGSKERGIEELRRAAEKGRYASDDARVLLIAVYAREGQHEKALEMVNQLADRYPRNYYFPVEAANIMVRMGRKREGFAAFESMLQDNRFQEVKDLIHFQYAQTLSANGYNTAARHHYHQVTTMPQANPQLISLAHLRIGQLLDLRGERTAAMAAYKIVLDQDNVFDSHEQAQQYLNKPFDGRQE